MATLLTCRDLAKRYHARPFLRGLSLGIADDDRVGLIGPNGAGKSTLLKIMAGLIEPDDGEVSLRRGARVSYLAQEDVFAEATVGQVLDEALAQRIPEPHERHVHVAIALDRAGFADETQPVATLSGGWRKRLAIARAWLDEPDLLLLDEPTNHLDLEGVAWLEGQLREAPFAYVVVSHDRYLLDNAAQRIVELNPVYAGGCFSVGGPYSTFLTRREELLAGQRSTEHVLAQKVKREIEWMKEGRKAQRIKQQSRKDDAYEMIDALADLRARNRMQSAAAGIDFDATGRKTRKLLVASGLGKSHPSGSGVWLFRNLDLFLSPGTRIGLLGANGSGKTTLIRVLTGDFAPDEGAIQRAENLKVVVFDQKREELPRGVDLLTAMCGTGHTVEYRGRPLHVASWAQRLLFTQEQLFSKIEDLSGGEQARILLARMMLRPADVLILDEPTNDLDIPTLDVLEESLESFPGAVLLVSHDRYLLDRVCTEVVGLNGDGTVSYFGDSGQWLAARAAAGTAPKVVESMPDAAPASPKAASPSRKKLSYKDQLELDRIEVELPRAEAEHQAAQAAVDDPAVASDHVELQKRYDALAAASSRVDDLYARWMELDTKR